MSRVAEQFELLPTIDQARTEWAELARGGASVFATWEWHATWWRHFGEGKELMLAACRSGEGALVALLPLYVVPTRPLRVLRFLGHGVADEIGPVCADPDRLVALEAAVALLRSGRLRWDVFIGDILPVSEGWSARLDGDVLWRERSPAISFADQTWDEFLSTRSANFRQEVRRKERRLLDGGASFRRTDHPARLEEDIDTLFRLHTARWDGVHSAFAANERFHREFARLAFERGWLRLLFLDVAGEPIAGYMGFRYAGVEFYYQAGRLPGWDSRSVGLVLLAHSVRTALEEGAKEYRFLGGDQGYKLRFANVDRPVETFVAGGSLAGRATLGVRAASRKFRVIRRALRPFRRVVFGAR